MGGVICFYVHSNMSELVCFTEDHRGGLFKEF